ncbi:MAG TPA: DNA primase [Tepidisphaeraceae bacterium]|nr:DNA primase [Tepidisphaeraceae bacterium]
MNESSNDGKTRVLQAIDIVELISQTVKLRRRGKDYVGLCPFHQEKTPSFKVDPARQMFYCFGCKASGNAIDFVIKRDRIEFVEALQLLARQANVELPRLGVNKQNSSERQVLLEAHSAACGLFEKLFSHPQHGAVARDYLAKRGFSAEMIRKYQIGLAVESWDMLLKSRAMKKFTPQQLAMAGLVKAREGGEGFYDTFRNRIIFPIRDEQGRVIAFGGREMPGSENPPKYLNSPETPLFSKGRCIYGLDHARQSIVETRTVAVVEGYTDVIMSHQYGATNVVSVLGTAMTEQHVAILKRFADRIVLLFDADAAGDAAANRAVELLLSQPVEIAIASIPDGLDPDEYLMQHGLESFQKLLADAQDALSFKWKQLLHDFGAKGDLTSQQKAIEQYMTLLAGARGSGRIDPLRWGAILARVSRLTEIPTDELNKRFKSDRKRPRASVETRSKEPEPASSISNASAAPSNARDRAERWVLGALLAEPSRWAGVQHELSVSDFSDQYRQKLAEVYWAHQRDDGEPVFSELLGLLDNSALKELAIELVQETEAMGNLDRMLTDGMAHLKQIRHKQDKNSLVAQLRASQQAPEDEIALLRKLQDSVRRPDIGQAAP